MRKQRTMLTSTQIVDAYKLAKMGAKPSEILEKTGCHSYAVVKAVENQLRTSGLTFKNYQKAIKQLRKEGYFVPETMLTYNENDESTFLGIPPNGSATARQVDPYMKLQNAIEEVIVSAVTSKVDEVRKENETLKSELSKKNAVIEEFKNSNWFTNLKKKLEGV